ncbi:MAG TPA: hypothetical protein VJT73_04270, partial [Polyangiaceae bacterium]|nr:hypothetical protein [Polyangiaceae bacterium]
MRTPLLHQCLGVTLSVSLVTSSALLAKPKRAPADPAPVAAIATPAPPASATTAMKPLSETLTGSAKTDYDAAKILYQDGDYSGASLKFKQSYEASKDVRLLWNMAACEKSQRHYAKVQKLV